MADRISRQHFQPMSPVQARVVRMDLLRFLAGCRKRRVNEALSGGISTYRLMALEKEMSTPPTLLVYFLIVLLFIRAPFCVLLVYVGICSVFWLFWLSCQYLPSDWLERLL